MSVKIRKLSKNSLRIYNELQEYFADFINIYCNKLSKRASLYEAGLDELPDDYFDHIIKFKEYLQKVKADRPYIKFEYLISYSDFYRDLNHINEDVKLLTNKTENTESTISAVCKLTKLPRKFFKPIYRNDTDKIACYIVVEINKLFLPDIELVELLKNAFAKCGYFSRYNDNNFFMLKK